MSRSCPAKPQDRRAQSLYCAIPAAGRADLLTEACLRNGAIKRLRPTTLRSSPTWQHQNLGIRRQRRLRDCGRRDRRKLHVPLAILGHVEEAMQRERAEE